MYLKYALLSACSFILVLCVNIIFSSFFISIFCFPLTDPLLLQAGLGQIKLKTPNL